MLVAIQELLIKYRCGEIWQFFHLKLVNRGVADTLAIDFGGMRFTGGNCLDDRGGSLTAHELTKNELEPAHLGEMKTQAGKSYRVRIFFVGHKKSNGIKNFRL